MDFFDPGQELAEAGVTFESFSDFACGFIGGWQS
jgi:hypothetical protein